MIDILIKNARLIDGTSAPACVADILIKDERICDVIRHDGAFTPGDSEAKTVIDAADRIVTPGFVDAHSHSDFNVLINPGAESKIHQGVTTEIVGNCGASAFPLRGASLQDALDENQSYGLEIDWPDAAGYLDRINATRPSVNIATFVGHGNIRASVIGYEDRPPSQDDSRAMAREVEAAMDAGALGLSTGLIYAPGLFADTAEIIELQRTAARRGGIYSSHVRGEGDELPEAAREFLEIVQETDCQGQFSHIKASGPRNWGKVKAVIDDISRANDHGGRIWFDKYPYIASSTSLSSLLPRWIRAGGRDATLEQLADTSLRKRIITESVKNNEGRDGWNSVTICDAACDRFGEFQGASIGDIARKTGMTADDIFIEVLMTSRLDASICNFTMSQDDTDYAITHPLGMIGSDSGCRAPSGPLSKSCPHPRSYGTFGKYFRDYVRERPLLTLENAVAKITSMVCDIFGLKNRGRIAPGCYADVLILDIGRFSDRATYTAPHQFCSGLDTVIVNGGLTIHNGEATGRRNGKALRRQ